MKKLLILALILGALPSAASTTDEQRIIYLAPPKSYPCKSWQASNTCFTFNKEDAVLKIKMPKSIWDGKTVTSGLSQMSLMVTDDKIFSTQFVPGTRVDQLRSNQIDPEWVSIALSKSDAAFVQQTLRGHLVRPSGASEYIESKSYVDGYTMYDLKDCLDYDSTQIDKAHPNNGRHPKFSVCELRNQYFVPKGRTDVYVSCDARMLFKGQLRTNFCHVESFMEPGLVLGYGIRGRTFLDASWNGIDKRLRAFFLSKLVAN